MATSLISDSQKSTIKAIIDDIHETFARSITIFEEGKTILISVDDILIAGNIQDQSNNVIDTKTFFKTTYSWNTEDDVTVTLDSGPLNKSYGVIAIRVDSFGAPQYWALQYYNDNAQIIGEWRATYNNETTPIGLAFTATTGSGTPIVKSLSNRSQYNGVYGRTGGGSSTSTTRTSVSHTIKARIKYINAREQNLADGNINSQLDIELIDGSVRITVDADGFAILKEAKRCEFEGRKYTIESKGNPTGIFGPQYYHFFLSPIEE